MERKRRRRCAFTPIEDALLKYFVMIFGDHNWIEVASHMIDRSPRQCRERYCTYLMPTLNNRPWTKQEDDLLISLVEKYSRKWVVIAKHFQGRSDSNVKNRWYTHLRKGRRNRKQEVKPVTAQSRTSSTDTLLVDSSSDSNDISQDDSLEWMQSLISST